MAAAVLANFQAKSQLSASDAVDGRFPENSRFDCVATSAAMAAQWLTGRHVTGDELKDAEYGESYAGAGTSLRRYVDDANDRLCAVYGVSAEIWLGEPLALVQHTHQLIQQGFPVIATIPSAWATPHTDAVLDASPFSTHVICFYGETSGYSGLRAKNPWGGFDHIGDDTYWRARLCDRSVWRIYRVSGAGSGVNSMLDLAQVSGFFAQDGDGWKCKQNGITIWGAMLPYYRSLPGPAGQSGVLPFPGLPVRDKQYIGDVAFMVCERAVLVYDPNRSFDNPAGAQGPCYLAHIDDPRVQALMGVASNADAVALKSQNAQLQGQVSAAATALKQADDEIAALKSQIESNKAQALVDAIKAAIAA
jgi:hypothetical protein